MGFQSGEPLVLRSVLSLAGLQDGSRFAQWGDCPYRDESGLEDQNADFIEAAESEPESFLIGQAFYFLPSEVLFCLRTC